MKPKLTVAMENTTCRSCGGEIETGSICAGIGKLRFCTMRDAMIFEAVKREWEFKNSDNPLVAQLAQALSL